MWGGCDGPSTSARFRTRSLYPRLRLQVQELHRQGVIDPDGELADYAGADVIGLNPVLRGSGTSLKLLHYLAHDLPVLSTPFGLRGLEELSPWVSTADLDAFTGALRGELAVPDGVRDALARYAWDRIARDALQVYRSLTGRA